MLSWQETRRALEIQEKLFVAQDGPRLELVNVDLQWAEERALIIEFKNEGGSDALQVCSVYARWDSDWQSDNCGPNFSPKGTVLVRRGRTLRYLLDDGQVIDAVGGVPTSARLGPFLSLDDACPQGETPALLVFNLAYSDILGNASDSAGQVLVCTSKSQ